MSNQQNACEHVSPGPAEIANRDHFQRIYCQWLKARANYMEPGQDDETCGKRGNAADEAARQLIAAPAVMSEHIWRKWEVLDFYLHGEGDTAWTDNRTIVALASIKADLMRFGIKPPDDD